MNIPSSLFAFSVSLILLLSACGENSPHLIAGPGIIDRHLGIEPANSATAPVSTLKTIGRIGARCSPLDALALPADGKPFLLQCVADAHNVARWKIIDLASVRREEVAGAVCDRQNALAVQTGGESVMVCNDE
ncbi:MAG: hypothetical protein JSS20_15070 [Proteobacteria bacterium]|nr:hypothetical protein [Pseudomonadota bacterium]